MESKPEQTLEIIRTFNRNSIDIFKLPSNVEISYGAYITDMYIDILHVLLSRNHFNEAIVYFASLKHATEQFIYDALSCIDGACDCVYSVETIGGILIFLQNSGYFDCAIECFKILAARSNFLLEPRVKNAILETAKFLPNYNSNTKLELICLGLFSAEIFIKHDYEDTFMSKISKYTRLEIDLRFPLSFVNIPYHHDEDVLVYDSCSASKCSKFEERRMVLNWMTYEEQDHFLSALNTDADRYQFIMDGMSITDFQEFVRVANA